MAKIKIRPRPGALAELLKQKGMTQVDASEKTRVDRKTLSRIDRGEEVKLETLQQVVTKLQVTEEYFLHLPAAETVDNGDAPGTIMLRKLDAARLKDLFEGANRVIWHLNAHISDDEVRKFLKEFETALEDFRKQHDFFHPESDSLRFQLDRLKTADDIAARLEKLAEHRIVLLGAGHLFWKCSCEEHSYEDRMWISEHYSCSFTVLVSVEPIGTLSRREHIHIGNSPPSFAPDTETAVFVNGRQLPSLEEL